MILDSNFVKVQMVSLFGKNLFFLTDNSFDTFLFVSLKSMFKNCPMNCNQTVFVFLTT